MFDECVNITSSLDLQGPFNPDTGVKGYKHKTLNIKRLLPKARIPSDVGMEVASLKTSNASVRPSIIASARFGRSHPRQLANIKTMSN